MRGGIFIVLLRSWNDFTLSKDRKLIIYGVDEGYREIIIDFFNPKEIIFADRNILNNLTEQMQQLGTTIIDMIVYSTVDKQNIAWLIRKLNPFEIYLYIGKANEQLTFDSKKISFLRSVLLHRDIQALYSDINIPLYTYFHIIDEEKSTACDFVIADCNQSLCLPEFMGRYTNHFLGKRKTCFQHEFCDHKIHMFGDSRVYGIGVEDQFTFCSLLQKN